MPYYLRKTCIDWHYERVTPELREFVQRANLSLSSSHHTLQTFEKELRSVAAEKPTVVADALIEDGFRQYWLYSVRGGVVIEVEVEERPVALDRPVSLPRDDTALVDLVGEREEIAAALAACSDFDGGADDEFELPLAYTDEPSMREVLARVALAIESGEHRFVAEVDDDSSRFLVELRPGDARVSKLIVVTEPDLVNRLLRRRYAKVPAPPRKRSP
jgi:hypothetical protein